MLESQIVQHEKNREQVFMVGLRVLYLYNW